MNAREKDQEWSCARDNPSCILKVEGGQACINAIGAGSCKRRFHGPRSDFRIIMFTKKFAAAASAT